MTQLVGAAQSAADRLDDTLAIEIHIASPVIEVQALARACEEVTR